MISELKINSSDFSEKPFRILSIDGGGVRGLIPLRILCEIEERTQRPISQLFDLIVGTSTGGIIALCIAAQKGDKQPKYTAQEVWNLYYQNSPKIFKKSLLRSFYTGLGLWAPKYDRSNLDEALYDFFGNLRLSQVVSPVIITSYSLTKDALSLWMSSRAQQDPSSNILMRDAAGATSAAPIYFTPKLITLPDGNKTCEVDGGIYANDPEAVALTEALLQNSSLKPEQIFILSLGTGRPKLKPKDQKLRNKGILGWLLQVNLIDLILNADALFGKFEVQASSLVQRYRIQLDLDSKNCAMDNTSLENLQNLSQVSANFIQKSEYEIAKLCEFLVQNPTKTLEEPQRKNPEILEATV